MKNVRRSAALNDNPIFIKVMDSNSFFVSHTHTHTHAHTHTHTHTHPHTHTQTHINTHTPKI